MYCTGVDFQELRDIAVCHGRFNKLEFHQVVFHGSVNKTLCFLFLNDCNVQSTPDNSNLQGKLKIVRVIGSSKKIPGSKKKTVFTFNNNVIQ